MTKSPTKAATKPAAKTPRKTTASAGAAAPKRTRKPKVAPAAAEAVVTPVAEVAAGPEELAAIVEAPGAALPVLRKQEFVERVVALSGVKKKTAKVAVEAALQVLGEALEAGEQLALPPLGTLHRIKAKGTAAGGAMMTVKLKRHPARPAEPAAEAGAAAGAEAEKDPLAAPAE